MADPIAIPVSQGNVAYVDEADAEVVLRHRWYVLTVKRSLTQYARTKISGKTVYLHRLIMNPSEGLEVDHIDGNGLNNVRSNLRLTSHSDNMHFAVARRAYRDWKASQAQNEAIAVNQV